MDSTDYGQLAYLVLMGVAVGGWLMAEHRQALGPTLRQALAWSFIFLGVIAGFGLWDDVNRTVSPQQMVFSDGTRIETPIAPDGHYYLTLDFNGLPISFVVDTGATDIVLRRADAERLGIDTDGLTYNGTASTANGRVRTANMRIAELQLGGVVDRDVPITITEGEMDKSLLGMSYLARFSRLEISQGRLILER